MPTALDLAELACADPLLSTSEIDWWATVLRSSAAPAALPQPADPPPACGPLPTADPFARLPDGDDGWSEGLL